MSPRKHPLKVSVLYESCRVGLYDSQDYSSHCVSPRSETHQENGYWIQNMLSLLKRQGSTFNSSGHTHPKPSMWAETPISWALSPQVPHRLIQIKMTNSRIATWKGSDTKIGKPRHLYVMENCTAMRHACTYMYITPMHNDMRNLVGFRKHHKEWKKPDPTSACCMIPLM